MAVALAPVVSLGDNCLDVYQPPVARVLAGGSCLNVAVWLSRLGLPAAYVGAIGGDQAGKAVLAELETQGVDASHVRFVDGEATAVTEIALEEEGERRFLRESYEIHERYVPSDEEWAFVAAGRHVHASRIPRLLERLLALGASGSPVSYDFSVDPSPKTLDGLDVAFLPHDALPAGTAAAEAVEALVRRGCVCAVVTRGPEGSVAATATEVVAVEAASTSAVVDTCGAGDAFIAAFLAARLARKPLRACLEDGAQAGAEACSIIGAFPQRGVASLAQR